MNHTQAKENPAVQLGAVQLASLTGMPYQNALDFLARVYVDAQHCEKEGIAA